MYDQGCQLEAFLIEFEFEFEFTKNLQVRVRVRVRVLEISIFRVRVRVHKIELKKYSRNRVKRIIQPRKTEHMLKMLCHQFYQF